MLHKLGCYVHETQKPHVQCLSDGGKTPLCRPPSIVLREKVKYIYPNIPSAGDNTRATENAIVLVKRGGALERLARTPKNVNLWKSCEGH